MNDIRTFLMLGRPGSGKGTQGKLLADKVGGVVYSSGSYLRPLSQEDTFVGRKVKEVMERGDLLPDWFSIFVFERALLTLEPQDGIIFEGACRRLAEAQAFKRTVEWLERPYKAVFLDVPEEVLKKRLVERRAVEGRADDATLEIIENRFKTYKENTEPSIDFFRKEGTLVTVEGNHPIEEVHQHVLEALKLS
jgi:adenylate kinase